MDNTRREARCKLCILSNDEYIDRNKWTISWGMSIMGRQGKLVGSPMGILDLSLQFCCVPKTVLKYIYMFFKIRG